MWNIYTKRFNPIMHFHEAAATALATEISQGSSSSILVKLGDTNERRLLMIEQNGQVSNESQFFKRREYKCNQTKTGAQYELESEFLV